MESFDSLTFYSKINECNNYDKKKVNVHVPKKGDRKEDLINSPEANEDCINPILLFFKYLKYFFISIFK